MVSKTIQQILKGMGYRINNNAYTTIEQAYNWYKNKAVPNFHDRRTLNNMPYSLNRLNFAKRCCSDEANLCEVIKINAGKNKEQHNFVNEVLDANNFKTMFRRQVEQCAALGTMGAYVKADNIRYLSDSGEILNAEIIINYIDAFGIIPLTIKNEEITECAFCGTNIEKTKEYTSLVVFTLDENNIYNVRTLKIDDDKIISDETFGLGYVKPFAILKTAETNNIENMEGFGFPKIFSIIPYLKGLDLAYNTIFSDLEKSEKIVLINELMCQIDPSTGKPYLDPEKRKVFVPMGQEQLPDASALVQEYNPIIRINEVKSSMEFLLGMISNSFGFGMNKYSFDMQNGITATQVVMSKASEMQDRNKQLEENTRYISDLCKAIMWFSNAMLGTNWDLSEKILVDFDDSIIEDTASKLNSMRDDALSFNIPQLTINYLAEKYNLSLEEAKKWYDEGNFSSLDEEQDSLEAGFEE